jgi:predicted nucleic acid-binding protein
MAGATVQTPDLHRATRRVASHAAQTRDSPRLKPYRAGHLVNQLKELAEHVWRLPRVQRSPDPTDDFLLAMCEAGKADYLVTGDKSDLLTLARHRTTRIVSAREFAGLFA